MCDSSPLFFDVVFQQSHPIPAVNKTVLLKKHPFRKHLTSAFIFIFGNYFVSTQKQQAGPTRPPQMHEAARVSQAGLTLSKEYAAEGCTTSRSPESPARAAPPAAPLKGCCAARVVPMPLSAFWKCSRHPWNRNDY